MGKLDLNGHTPEEFIIELGNSFFIRKDLLDIDLASAYQLPKHHKDPFDRMLFWSAIQNDFTLLSADSASDSYKQEGLKVIH